MNNKPIKWPKWTEQYEDIKENNKTIIKVTRADRAWDRVDDLAAGLVAGVRHLATEFRAALIRQALK